MYDESWMRYRLNIFRKYTLPSVLQQTSQDFRWFIFFDQERTRTFQHDIDGIFKDNVIQVYADDLHDIPAIVNDNLPQKTKTLISSRLDSDDMLHCKFIADVRRMADRVAQSQEGCGVVDFPKTLMFDTPSRKIFAVQKCEVTQYGSLVETGEVGGYSTALKFNHTTLGDHYPIYNSEKTRTMTVFHDRNWLTKKPKWGASTRIKHFILRRGLKSLRLSDKERSEFGIAKT
jgi:hypothetical protein